MFWGEGHVSVFGDTGGVGGEMNDKSVSINGLACEMHIEKI